MPKKVPNEGDTPIHASISYLAEISPTPDLAYVRYRRRPDAEPGNLCVFAGSEGRGDRFLLHRQP
jgi:hypothetical protein